MGPVLRAGFPGVAISVEGNKFLPAEANSRQALRYRPQRVDLVVSRLLLRGQQVYGSVAQIRAAPTGAAGWRHDCAKGQEIAG